MDLENIEKMKKYQHIIGTNIPYKHIDGLKN